MARVNTMAQPRPTRPIVHKQLSDGKNVADVYLQANDMPAQVRALEIATINTELYLTGNKQKDPPVEVRDFPPVGGQSVNGLSETFFQHVASIWCMQREEDSEGNKVPDEMYSFNELVGMTITMPKLWGLMVDMAAEVRRQYEADLPNG